MQTPEQAAAQEALKRQAEAATAALEAAALTPLQGGVEDGVVVLSYEEALNAMLILPAAEVGSRLEALAADLEQAEREPLGLSTEQRQTLRKTAQKLRAWAAADYEGAVKPVGYLTRSQFARLAQVSANTLVKWHNAGSLVPAYTHPLTRYRYYKPEQVAEVRAARQRKPRKAAK